MTDSSETVSLFRAVTAAEREDILRLNGFRTFPGQMEAKQFATTLADASYFGEKVVERFDREMYWIVQAVLPRDILGHCLFLELDTRSAYSVHANDLALFNESIQDLIWHE